MAELEPTPSYYSELHRVSDIELVDLVKEIIYEVITEKRIYYDEKDQTEAVETIYPAIANILFDPKFSHLRDNHKAMVDIVAYLTLRLS